ncbi:gas vesicle protein GvpO [Streptomyces umbrinus]|uniref:gas vesicle protein GvpO n=1 Tax=Streptomyces umbrinus TaxID=67370 RepID=UPI0027D8C4DC|nr:gas vesicle protein [Streptomyces umbrinus]
MSVMRSARAQLAELLGRTPESVTAIGRDGTGWQVDIEVVELERIPDSTSILAVYQVRLDANGLLLGYARSRRYTRGQVDRQ